MSEYGYIDGLVVLFLLFAAGSGILGILSGVPSLLFASVLSMAAGSYLLWLNMEDGGKR